MDRATAIFERQLACHRASTDRMFGSLLVLQWVLAVGLALVFSPTAWAGKSASVHFHVQVAVVLGAVINALPIGLALARPGHAATRHVIAVAQMLWSALLIHLTGGRIETHFHVFGSLAFLAFYRDYRILLTATIVVAGDHLVRGYVWPQSVFGIADPQWWRVIEHAAWVIFENSVLMHTCRLQLREMRALAEREASLEGVNATIEQEVADKTESLTRSVERYRCLVESTSAIPWEMNGLTQRITYRSPQTAQVLGLPQEAIEGDTTLLALVHADDRGALTLRFEELAKSADGTEATLDYRLVTGPGQVRHIRDIVRVQRSGDGGSVMLRGVMLDVTPQVRLELELRQAQKLESVGRLAAGVAHEINTPVQFVSDSVHFVHDATRDMSIVVSRYRELQAAVAAGEAAGGAAAAAAMAEAEVDLDYLLEQVPAALDRSLDGLSRITTIVRSMKEFAHPDQKQMAAADVNQSIASTLVIARNEYKYVADVVTDFGELPRVTCHPGDLNQAVLNIVVNAAHAIADRVASTGDRGRIGVTTRVDGDAVVIAIADTGGGIPESIRHQIFDPFFTTKDVGAGTGQGLAIARQVVCERHGGELTFDTELGVGTTFHIRLPIDGRLGVESGVAA